MTASSRLPLWFKVGYTLWVVAWVILYKRFVGWHHFLWMCHLANVLVAVGLWLESPLILSWQALAVLVGDLVWCLDFALGLTLGQTPLGSAWYMFSAKFEPLQKSLALFHLVMPVMLIALLLKFGYDRRALLLQAATCAVLFPISFLVSKREDNINWVLGPFGQVEMVQELMSPMAFLFVAIALYMAALYVPSHLVLMALVRRPNNSLAASRSRDDGIVVAITSERDAASGKDH